MIPEIRKSAGVLRPSELDVLSRVLGRICERQSLRPDSEDASDAAIRVLYFYERGITDEHDLFAAATGQLEAVRRRRERLEALHGR